MLLKQERALCKLDGTKTEQFLRDAASLEAFALAESELCAEKAGGESLAALEEAMRSVALNNRTLASLWMAYLGKDGDADGMLADESAEALYAAETFYPEMARTAAEEGFDEIAQKCRMTAGVKKAHGALCAKWHDALTSDSCLTGGANTRWVCGVCGYTVHGNRPPRECPLCGWPMAAFARLPGADEA